LGKDIVTKLGDGLHGTPIYDDNGEYYFINGSNLVDGKIDINSNTKKVTEEEFVKYKKDLSDKTILLGINGTIGNVALYNNELCILGKSAAYLNINDDFDKQFIRYVLTNDHFQNYIKNNASGTTIKNVGLGLLREYQFSAPEDKAIQQEIAQILTSLDDKIELNLQMNQTLEAMAQALFKEWFVNFNFPNFDGELENGLPKGWRMGKLNEVATLIAGGDKPKNVSEVPTEQLNIPIYSNGISNEGIYGYTDLARINVESVTVSARGTIGFVCLRSRPFLPIVRLISVIPNLDIITAKYLFIWLKNQNIQGNGTTQQQLTVPDFYRYEILIPDYDTIKMFTKILDSFFEKINENKIQIQTLTQTRDTLLPKLMSGKIDIK
jgi:type I restriction enzyme S subunit